MLRKKEEKPEKSLPAHLQTLADEALFMQIASSRYEKLYKEIRVAFTAALEEDPDTDVMVDETFKHQSGTFRYGESRKTVNVATLIQLIQDGKATVETVLMGCVSMFNTTNLSQSGLGGAVEEPEGKTPILTFRASADYRAQVNGILDQAEFEVPNVAASKKAKLELVPQLEKSVKQAKAKKAAEKKVA